VTAAAGLRAAVTATAGRSRRHSEASSELPADQVICAHRGCLRGPPGGAC